MADAQRPRPAPENEVVPAETPTLASLMTLLVGVVAVAALYFGRDVFLPIVLAVLLAFVLAPFVDLLRRLRLGRVSAVIVAVLVALGVIGTLGTVIGLQVAELASDLPRYEHDDPGQGRRAAGRRPRPPVEPDAAPRTRDRAGDEGRSAPRPRRRRRRRSRPSRRSRCRSRSASPISRRSSSRSASSRRSCTRWRRPASSSWSLIFILLQREDLRDRMIRLFGSSDLHRTTAAMDDAARRLSRFFLTQLALNAAFGVVIAVGLWMIGVPSPVLWGIFAALMRFVPYIGSFIAAPLPIALAAAVDPGWSMMLLDARRCSWCSEPLMGHVVEPLVYGQSTGLSPFAVVVSAIFWTWLWGPIGLLLATPLTLCLVVLGRHVERLEFFDVLLGDRPALSPAENFYQRMLAGDPDEALEHAEQLLKERSLSSYYDEVALKGLQLAANDAARGVARPGRSSSASRRRSRASSHDLRLGCRTPSRRRQRRRRIRSAPRSPRRRCRRSRRSRSRRRRRRSCPRAGAARRRSCASPAAARSTRRPSTMLAQLLRKHGLGAPRRAARGGVALEHRSASTSRASRWCACPTSRSAATRRTCAISCGACASRSRDAPILVGLWPAEEAVLTDESLRAAIGADYYVTSLREALKAALEAARAAAQKAAEAKDAEQPAKVAAE